MHEFSELTSVKSLHDKARPMCRHVAAVIALKAQELNGKA